MSNERIQGFYIRNPIYTKTISDNLKIELPYCRVSERKIINSITFLQKLNFCTNTKYANTMNVLFHFLNGTLFYFILISADCAGGTFFDRATFLAHDVCRVWAGTIFLASS